MWGILYYDFKIGHLLLLFPQFPGDRFIIEIFQPAKMSVFCSPVRVTTRRARIFHVRPSLTTQSAGQNRALLTRSNATKQVVEKLPLAGIRILDMTRVLAGVSGYHGGPVIELD